MKFLINMFGGPGAGKSTGACYVFSQLKLASVPCEYIPEFHKAFTYTKTAEEIDWHIITPLQISALVSALHTDQIVITDCPLQLIKHYQGLDIEASIPTDVVVINVIVKRVKEYRKEGRWHTEAESLELDTTLSLLADNPIFIDGDRRGYKKLSKIIKMLYFILYNH